MPLIDSIAVTLFSNSKLQWDEQACLASYLGIPAEAEHDLEDDILKDKVLIVVWNS